MCNSEPNSLGISVQCGKDVEKIRSDIDKQLKKGNDVSGFHDEPTMAILKKRMESNVALYINGSDAKEKTARSELWKWYLIFKKLRPSDEIPLNPCEIHFPVLSISASNVLSSRFKAATIWARRQS